MLVFFISGLMDALSDPRAFVSAQEKRVEQMKALGIDEDDIRTKDIIMGKSGISSTPNYSSGGTPMLPTPKVGQ